MDLMGKLFTYFFCAWKLRSIWMLLKTGILFCEIRDILLLGRDLGQHDLEVLKEALILLLHFQTSTASNFFTRCIATSTVAGYRRQLQVSHLYFAYHMFHEYCENPFTLAQPEVMLHSSLLLLNVFAEILAPLLEYPGQKSYIVCYNRGLFCNCMT
jgi:hypothetical protein